MWMQKKVAASAAAVALVVGIGSLMAQYQNPYGTVPPAPPQPPQAPAQYQYQPAPQQAQNNPALAEAQNELKKLEIQSRLAERIAQVKEDARRLKASQNKAGAEGPSALWDAEGDAAQARAGADMAKVDVQILDLQIRSGLINPPPAAPQGGPQGQFGSQQPGGANSAAIAQILQLEARKAHIQAGVAAMLRDLRQKQYDFVKSQVDGGTAPQEKLMDATVDLESAKAGAEIAALDEGMANSRVQQGVGR
jgi:hypothetical protein